MSWIFKGRLLIGIILISVGIIILLSSLIWYQVFLFLSIGLVVVVGIGMTFEFARIFYQSEFNVKRLAATFYMSSYAYISLLLFFFLMIFSDKANLIFILIIAPVGVSDGISFIAGKTKGKKKITKRISPGKTRFGTLAGYLASLVTTRIILEFLFPYLEFWQIIMISFSIPLLAFMGDLIESFYKRVMGVKDSGNVFRGHGGVLDRTDSFLLPIYFICLWAFWFL